MAIAQFNKLAGDNAQRSSLIMVKRNPFEFSMTPVYVPTSAVCAVLGVSKENLEKGMEFEIDLTGAEFVPILNEDGEPIVTKKEGAPLLQLRYKH